MGWQLGGLNHRQRCGSVCSRNVGWYVGGVCLGSVAK